MEILEAQIFIWGLALIAFTFLMVFVLNVLGDIWQDRQWDKLDAACPKCGSGHWDYFTGWIYARTSSANIVIRGEARECEQCGNRQAMRVIPRMNGFSTRRPGERLWVNAKVERK